MNVKLYLNVFVVTCCLVIVILSGCAPEENDLVPPNASFDGDVVTSPTQSTTTPVSGKMDPGSTIEVDVSTSAIITNLVQDSVLGTWSFTVSGMIEGANILFVSVADAVGNTRTIQFTIVVDLTAPVTTIKQYPVKAQAGTFTFAGTVTEYNSKVLLEVIDSSGTSVSGSVDADANIWIVPNLDLSGLLPGDCTVVATGTDRLGNVSMTPTTQLITLDAGSPAFVINPLTRPPVFLLDPSTVSQVSFDGTRVSDTPMAVTSTSGVVGLDLSNPLLWNTDVSSLSAGNSVVTFDGNDGGTIEKVLVVRDQTAPIVVKWSSAVGLDQVTVLFNEAMNPAMIEPTNLTILDSTATVVNVSGVAANGDREFIFTTGSLIPGETYTATLQTTDSCILTAGCTVEDIRGNSLAASYSWTFKK